VILGISCVVFFGLVAIYQTWAAHQYQEIFRTYKKATERQLESQLTMFQEAIDGRDRQFAAIAAALPMHHAAALRGDARQCNAILASAIAQANAIAKTASRTEFSDRPGASGAPPG
jgi:hypothetical protein